MWYRLFCSLFIRNKLFMRYTEMWDLLSLIWLRPAGLGFAAFWGGRPYIVSLPNSFRFDDMKIILYSPSIYAYMVHQCSTSIHIWSGSELGRLGRTVWWKQDGNQILVVVNSTFSWCSSPTGINHKKKPFCQNLSTAWRWVFERRRWICNQLRISVCQIRKDREKAQLVFLVRRAHYPSQSGPGARTKNTCLWCHIKPRSGSRTKNSNLLDWVECHIQPQWDPCF